MTTPEVHIELMDGLAPVQARGTIGKLPFFFYARRDGWAFSVALQPGADPRGITMNGSHGYYLEGDYGDEGGYDASYMPEQDVLRIVRECIQGFLSRNQS